MDFVFMFVMSLLALILTRVLFILIWNWDNKKGKKKKGKPRKVKKIREPQNGKVAKVFKKLEDLFYTLSPVFFSLIAFLTFLLLWGIAILVYLVKMKVSNELFFYVVFTFFGVAAIIWCYFRWDFKWRAKLRFEGDKLVMPLKKSIVFFVVMVIAFCYGYSQLNALLKANAKVDHELAVYNATMISGMIALDRVLNQVLSVCNGLKDKAGKQKEEQKDKKKD